MRDERVAAGAGTDGLRTVDSIAHSVRQFGVKAFSMAFVKPACRRIKR
jgi:hypothetical protein